MVGKQKGDLGPFSLIFSTITEDKCEEKRGESKLRSGSSMENREDVKSILPFLPVRLRSFSLFWPPAVVEALKALSQGPNYSNVNSGHVLFLAISDIRNSLSLPDSSISSSASDGFSLLFDDVSLSLFTSDGFVCFWTEYLKCWCS